MSHHTPGEAGAHAHESHELLVEDEAGVRTLRLNRPRAYNALNVSLKERLRDALLAAGTEDAVRAVVITGTGNAFCAGQDLAEHKALLESESSAPLQTVQQHYNPIIEQLVEMPKPVLAAVNGTAAGAGAGIAFACDMRIVSSEASFHTAFGLVGLAADSGMSWTLQRLVGYGRAMQLLMMGAPLASQEALNLGVANFVTAASETVDEARRIAAELASGPTLAYAMMKRQLAGAAGSGLREALAAEAAAQAELGETADHREGVAAFGEKRAASFIGR